MDDPSFISNRLNVNDLVAARKDDIFNLQNLLGSSGTQGKKRAFQSVPRTERRRAASHDAKRVPKKRGLRKQATFENLRDNAKKRNISKYIEKKKKLSSFDHIDQASVNSKATFPFPNSQVRYANRQKDKIWLPTHIWHTKRAFLQNVGGYMVPSTATQKQYRRTYRLSNHLNEKGTMAWDTSYYKSILIHGASVDSIVQKMSSKLKLFFPGIDEPIYSNGKKHWQGIFNKMYPATAHFYQASFFVTCRPETFDEIWSKLYDMRKNNLDIFSTIEDTSFAIGSIDIMGSKALQILTDILAPCHESVTDKGSGCSHFSSEWNQLGAAKSLTILPTRMCLQLVVSDPRLLLSRSKGNKKLQEFGSLSELVNYLQNHSRNGNYVMNIYNRDDRVKSIEAQSPQGLIDRMRSSKDKIRSDCTPQIPLTILLLDDNRIRLVLPRPWILPFWLCIFKRKRAIVGGFKELQEIAFERGLPSFPVDFPLTAVGENYLKQVELENRELYARKPPSKRPCYDRDIGDPFKIVDIKVLQNSSELPSQYMHVRVDCMNRGSLRPGARLFALKADELQRYQNNVRLENAPEINQDRLIGFITSGNFTLSKAKCSGLGIITETKDSSFSKDFCLVKNLASDNIFLSRLVRVDIFKYGNAMV